MATDRHSSQSFSLAASVSDRLERARILYRDIHGVLPSRSTLVSEAITRLCADLERSAPVLSPAPATPIAAPISTPPEPLPEGSWMPEVVPEAREKRVLPGPSPARAEYRYTLAQYRELEKTDPDFALSVKKRGWVAPA